MDAYFKAAKICRQVELYLKSKGTLSAKEVNNLRFYVAMVAGWVLAASRDLTVELLVQVNVANLTEELMERAFIFVNASYRRLGANDDVVKGAGFKLTLRRKAARQGLP